MAGTNGPGGPARRTSARGGRIRVASPGRRQGLLRTAGRPLRGGDLDQQSLRSPGTGVRGRHSRSRLLLDQGQPSTASPEWHLSRVRTAPRPRSTGAAGLNVLVRRGPRRESSHCSSGRVGRSRFGLGRLAATRLGGALVAGRWRAVARMGIAWRRGWTRPGTRPCAAASTATPMNVSRLGGGSACEGSGDQLVCGVAEVHAVLT